VDRGSVRGGSELAGSDDGTDVDGIGIEERRCGTRASSDMMMVVWVRKGEIGFLLQNHMMSSDNEAQDSPSIYHDDDIVRYLVELNAWLERFVHQLAPLTDIDRRTSDILAAIRDERLRFVDAMQAATTIHVEQQLSLLRAQIAADTSRQIDQLRQERDALETQVALLRQRLDPLPSPIPIGLIAAPTARRSQLTRSPARRPLPHITHQSGAQWPQSEN